MTALTKRFPAASLVGLVLWGLSAPLSHAEDRYLIAHRGGVVDADRSENSPAALREAIRRGYTHVEIDARITRDGVVVCFHNDSLEEETGHAGRLSAMDYPDLRRLRLSRSGEPIPTFDEYCAQAAGKINLMVDLKGCPENFIRPYAESILRSLRRHALLANALILINKHPVRNQARLVPYFLDQAKISWRQSLSDTKAAVRDNPRFASQYYIFNHGEDFTRQTVAGFQALGLSVIVSINTQHYAASKALNSGRAHIRSLMLAGVDGFQIDSLYDNLFFAEPAGTAWRSIKTGSLDQ